MTGRIRKGDVGEPVAIESSLGWVVCSRYNEHRMKDASTNLISFKGRMRKRTAMR